MKKLKLTSADFKETNSYYKEYSGTENLADFDGSIEIEVIMKLSDVKAQIS